MRDQILTYLLHYFRCEIVEIVHEVEEAAGRHKSDVGVVKEVYLVFSFCPNS